MLATILTIIQSFQTDNCWCDVFTYCLLQESGARSGAKSGRPHLRDGEHHGETSAESLGEQKEAVGE